MLVDDLENMHALANEIEEQAVKLRAELHRRRHAGGRFPGPYLTWSELQDMLSGRAWLELGRSTAGEHVPLAECFSPGPRYGGRLKPFLDYVTLGLQCGRAE